MSNMQKSILKPEWKDIIRKNCHFYYDYNDSDRSWFEQILISFLRDTEFFGHRITITDEIKITIGGWAVRMLMKLKSGSFYYSHVKVVKVYPGHDLKSGALGEMENGIFYCQICLAWDDVKKSISNHEMGSNTVLHEFAHALDQMDRAMNGVPAMLLRECEIKQWKTVFTPDYILNNSKGKAIWDYLGLSRWKEYDPGNSSCVDLPEMFSVATEKYFEDAERLNRVAPEMYEQMNILYKQDTLSSVQSPVYFDRFLDVFEKIWDFFKKLKIG
ncbi:hypothetical protein MNBD_GAMMA11-1650 [hydrothermal vent metagenome]|uniref:Inner membrane protein n=1 Tax=hydrothermal vent metagenome TaxID=652676 RepID=A0A3B0X2C4_9ZZZZ